MIIALSTSVQRGHGNTFLIAMCFRILMNLLFIAALNLNFRTPLHADVFTSHSWSVNIVGRKRWVLFPPGQEVYLKDRFGNLTYDIFSDATLNTNNFLLYGKIDKSYDIIQEPGEALFVPSGWHHQVWNLVSINSYEKHSFCPFFSFVFSYFMKPGRHHFY